MGHLAEQMKWTLQELLVQCLRDGRREGGSGINPNSYPSQVRISPIVVIVMLSVCVDGIHYCQYNCNLHHNLELNIFVNALPCLLHQINL